MWNFRNLKVVAESRTFVTAVYQASAGFPNTERCGLTNQLRRAAISIGSNIVEGSARSSRAEFARFLDIAVASSAECQFQLEIAADLGFLQPTVAHELVQQAEMIRRMTSKLKRRVLENEA
jgi:four helix bundle protein